MNMIKKIRFTLLIMPLFVFMLIANPITVEKTIPQDIQTSDILTFTINVKARTINICLENGLHGNVNNSTFLNFWNNTMTQTQRNVVKGFVKQLSALALKVDEGKVTGDLMD